jgi:hypothetical protein
MANFTFDQNALNQTLTRGNLVPTKIVSEGLLSNTSEAYECFTQQKFSGNLQAFLVNYVVTISGYYSLYV